MLCIIVLFLQWISKSQPHSQNCFKALYPLFNGKLDFSGQLVSYKPDRIRLNM